ncbi:hypothetical protein AMECASPLE_024478, partial [Ameca splendens]
EYSKSRKREKSQEAWHSEKQVAKHETLSRSSSEQSSSPSTHLPEHITHEKRLEQDEADLFQDTHTDENTKTLLVTHYQEKVAGRETITEQKNELVENDQSLEDKEDDKKRERVEKEEEHTDTFSRKRKSEPIFTYMTKRWRQQQLDSGKAAQNLPPGKQTNAFKKDSSSQVEQTPTNHTWTYSPLATQTVVVSPLRTERRQSKALPPELGEREVKIQKLAELEREAERLRILLGLEVSKTTQGTMTTADSVIEKEGMGGSRASTTSKEVGCQAVMAEVRTIYYDSKIHLQFYSYRP